MTSLFTKNNDKLLSAQSLIMRKESKCKSKINIDFFFFFLMCKTSMFEEGENHGLNDTLCAEK